MTELRPNQRKTHSSVIHHIREMLDGDWPAEIYRKEVLSGRTRNYAFTGPKRVRTVQITHTLLGIELKLGRRRIHMPDLATARYLSVFARLGVNRVAVPYDITRISHLADRLESACQRVWRIADRAARGAARKQSQALRSQILRALRTDLAIPANASGDLSLEPGKRPGR